MIYDDEELIKQIGVSRELTEHSQVEARIYNDFTKYRWGIHIHPPIEKTDIIYFKIYNNNIQGEIVQFTANKCARISMTFPKYVHCSDCEKEEWILTHDEKIHLCEILTDDVWKTLIWYYCNEIQYNDAYSRKIDIIKSLQKPDYMQLPE